MAEVGCVFSVTITRNIFQYFVDKTKTDLNMTDKKVTIIFVGIKKKIKYTVWDVLLINF